MAKLLHDDLNDNDPLGLYLQELARFALLSKEDEVRLAEQIELGNAAREQLVVEAEFEPDVHRELTRVADQGEHAQQAFVQANLRLVVSIAKRYRASEMPLLDLIQDGNLGLIHAVEKFDWRKGFKFSTYATWWIRQAIARGIANNGRTIRLPVHAGSTLAHLIKTRSMLELEHRRPVTQAELAAATGIPEFKVSEALRFAAVPVSLDEPVGPDSDVELADLVGDTAGMSTVDAAMLALLPTDVASLLGSINERERQILSLRFGLDRGEPRTLQEVGAHFNLTRERIRQIEAGALAKLRQSCHEATVRSLLDA